MARLRKFCAYRSLERPYTRFSKYKKHNFVRARPNCRVVRFDMGDFNKVYECTVKLLSKSDLQIRDNAIEAARQSSNRHLEKNLGKNQYHFKLTIYPHHILRENAIASGAGADRLSTGMQKSFGKPIGIAARVKKGQAIAILRCNKDQLEVGRRALKLASAKLPCGCRIVTEFNKPKVKVSEPVEEQKPAKDSSPKPVKEISA